MLQDFSNTLKYGTLFYGLDVTGPHDNPEYYLIKVKKNRDEIDVIENYYSKDLEEIVSKIPKLSPISLILRTDKVVVKTLDRPETGKTKTINEVFPRLNITDFFWELLEQGETVYGSICRKEAVNKIISKFTEARLFICSWSLGNLSMETLPLPIKNKYKNSSTPDDFLEIDGLELESKYITAFSGALNLAGFFEASSKNFIQEQKAQCKDYRLHRYFKTGLRCSIGILLLLLLINFTFFNHYYSQVTELEGLSQLNTEHKETLKDLISQTDRKEKMLKDVLKSSSSKASYYIDKIGGSIPKSILLENLNYCPLLRTVKTGSHLDIDSTQMVISGAYNDNLELSEWVSNLENFDFIAHVTISNLEKKEKDPTFELNLNLIPAK